MKKILFMLVMSALAACGSGENVSKTTLCEPYVIEGLAPAPDFWKVRPSQVIDLCKSVKVGKAEVIAETPAALNLYSKSCGKSWFVAGIAIAPSLFNPSIANQN